MTAQVISVGRRPRRWPRVVASAFALGAAAVGILLSDELDSSRWQARWLVEHARTLRFDLQPGADAAMRVPAHGPFDERLGYTQLPEHVAQLVARGYDVTAQARQSPALEAHIDRGLFAPFREKTQAGLSMFDCRADALYESRYPHQGWAQLRRRAAAAGATA